MTLYPIIYREIVNNQNKLMIKCKYFIEKYKSVKEEFTNWNNEPTMFDTSLEESEIYS